METTDISTSQETGLKNPKFSHLIQGLHHPVEFIQFIHWIATPKVYREPATQEELGDKLQLSQQTFADWKKIDGFYDAVYDLTKRWAQEKTPEVIASLYRTALRDGSAQEVKLWMQLIQDWKEKSETESKGIMKHYVISRGESRIAVVHATPEAGGDSDSSGTVQGGGVREEVREDHSGDQ